MSRFAQRAAAAVAAILICAATAFAQVDRATLTGVVKDPTDAVLRGAKVTVTSLATGVSTTVTTSNEGVYLVLNLPSGEYLVQAEATGFQRYEQTVSLELGARSRLDMSLAVGSIGETVKVEGVTPLLSTESAVLGTVVDKNEMDKLPLAIRNWDDLLAMVPGVQSDRYTEQAGGTSAGRTGGVSVHGNRSLQNNFLLDGVANNSFSTNVQELTTQLSRPSVDAIEEFKVVTSPYAAEYGWSPGAAIIVSTKSGTNRFRGTAYDFYRDDSMDTINYFAKAANQPKATNKQNQFGGNFGGPLMRNRAFFFADYEGTRLEQGVLRTGNVMTADQRRGVFTTSIRDPLTGQPFPNNTIPANRIDPVAAPIMQLVPLPNATGANNFIRQPNVEDTSDRYLVRVDVPIGNSNNLFVRYIGSNRVRFVPGWFGGVLDGTSTSAWGRNFLDSHAVVGGWNKVLGSSLVNESRVSYARGTNDGQQDPFGQSGMEQIGFKGVPDDPTRRRRHRRRRHRRPHSTRLAELHAEVPAHQPGAVDEHHDLDARQPPGQVRRRPDDADVQRVLRRGADARQSPLPGDVHGQRVRRLPDWVSESRRADERVRRDAGVVVELVLRAGRLEADRQADAQSRAAL